MSLQPFSGTGGGTELPLGRPLNVFAASDGSFDNLGSLTPATTRAAAETRRDAYATANPAWLADYTSNPQNNLGLYFIDGTDTVIQYQRRVAGTWVDNNALRAFQGMTGTGTLDQSLPLGTVLGVVQSGPNRIPGQVGLTSTVTEFVSGKTFMGPGGGAVMAGHFSIISAGSAMSIVDNIDNTIQGIVTHGKGVGDKPSYERTISTGSMVTTPANMSEESVGTTLQFAITNLNEGEAVSYSARRSAGATPITNCNLVVRRNSHTDPLALFDFRRDTPGGAGFTLNGGAGETDTTVVFPYKPFFGLNELLYFTVTGDGANDLLIRGETLGGQFIPATTVVGDFTVETDIITREELSVSDEAKLGDLTSFFRGNYDPDRTYLHGDIARSNYQGRPAMYISAAAQLPDAGLPETKLDTGFWFLLTDRTWRGTWAASDYLPGQFTTSGGDLWVSLQIIPASDTDAPSETNTAWQQVGGGSGGGSAGPVVRYERQTGTLPQTVADNTIVIVEPTGTDNGALINLTLPDATTAFVNRRVTVANNRPNVNGRVDVLLQTGDAIANIFGNVELRAGGSAEFYCAAENVWILVGDGEIPLFPQFPANPNNDDNTFMFSVTGDSSSTWARDRNTAINLNRAAGSSESYEIANPATTGIVVNDGDGYVFRNVNSVSWNIFPFSSANTMVVDGTTITSASPLSLSANNTLVLVYDSGQSRWEGTVLNFLTPLASPGAGGSSEANSSSLPDSGKRFAINEETVALGEAEGVSFRGLDSQIAMVKAGLGPDKFLEGFVVGDTPMNESNQVVYNGQVRTRDLWTGLNRIDAPLAASTLTTKVPLYFDNTNSRVRTDDESGVHHECGEVLSSDWIVAGANTFLADQTINNQTLWDAWVEKVQTKGYASNGEVQIPDLAEGSSEVTAVSGTRFIVQIPQGNGTFTIRPRGASTITPAPNSGASGTYTNTTPLPMTSLGGTGEFVVIEVRADGGYYHYPINQFGIVTQFYFSALDYFRKVYEGQSADMSFQIISNTQARETIQNPVRTTVNSTSYNLGVQTGVGARHLVRTAAGNATWTFADSPGAIPVGSSQSIYIDNSKRTDPILMVHAGRDFEGMGCDRMVVLPKETREFRLFNDNGTLQITPIGPVVYEFTLTAPDATNGQFDLSPVPAKYGQLFETPASGDVDRLVFRPSVAGDLACRIEFDSSWGGQTSLVQLTDGGNSTYFPNNTTLNARLDSNGAASTDVAIFNILHIFAEPSVGTFSHTFAKTGLVGNNWVDPVVTNRGAATNITTMKFHFKITLKEA